jgi:hypothetical protein
VTIARGKWPGGDADGLHPLGPFPVADVFESYMFTNKMIVAGSHVLGPNQ